MRKVLASLLSVATLLTVTACSSTGSAPAPSNGQSAAPAAKPLKKVSLVLDWYPNAVHSFIYEAQQEGYFKDEGLDVTIKMPADNPTDGIKLVGAGQETFALYYQADVLMARSEQIPIVSVAAIVRHPLNVLMARAETGVNSPKDLAGKTVGYPSTPMNVALVKTAVKNAGGDPNAVKFQDVSWDLIPAMAAKKVDGISGGYLNHEKLLLEKQGMKLKTFNYTDYGVPNFYELVLITGQQTADKDPQTVAAFWRALAKGYAKVKENPAAALDVLLKNQAQDSPLDKDVETQSMNLLLPMMDDNGKVKFGSQSADDWQKLEDWMVAEGVLKNPVKVTDAFRNIQ